MILNEIPDRIKYIAGERGIHTRYQLAARCSDVSKTTIYNAWNGSSISVDTLYKICKGLDCTLCDFFDYGEHKKRIDISSEESEVIEGMRSLTEKEYQRFKGYLEALCQAKIEEES